MRIVQLLSRVAQRYAQKEYSALTAQQVTQALAGINSGMMEMFRLLPETYRVRPIAIHIEAPVTVSLQAVNGSATLGNTPFTAEQVGRGVVSSGDTIRNQVADTNTLFDVWLGSTGTYSATVYHDYVYSSDYPFERIISNPKLVDGHLISRRRELEQVQPDDVRLQNLPSVGQPRFFYAEPGGVSQGGEPVIALRLFPLPDRDYRMHFRAAYWPRRVLFADIEGNAVLPIPDQCAEALEQMAGPHLVGVDGWSMMSRAEVESAASMARDFCRSQPRQLSFSQPRVFTPRGF